MNGAFRFIVHNAEPITNPRAETDTHYLLMGIDLDLDRAMRQAVWEVSIFSFLKKVLVQRKRFPCPA